MDKNHLEENWREITQVSDHTIAFKNTIWLPYVLHVAPRIQTLMLEQYPALNQTNNKHILKHITDINIRIASQIVIDVWQNVLKEQHQKVNLKRKYPMLEKWRAFYCMPPQPDLITDASRNIYYRTHYTDEQWEQHKAEENRKMKLFFDWTQSRKACFYDIAQAHLFHLLPELYNLENDYWVTYATCFGDIYEEWKTDGEHIETVLEYEMPAKTIHLYGKEFQDIFQPYFEKDPHRGEAERDKRIFG